MQQEIAEVKPLLNILNYLKQFSEKHIFQGEKSYIKIPNAGLTHTLITHLFMYRDLINREETPHIDKGKYIESFKNAWDNVELTEIGMTKLYLKIEEQENYLRSVYLIYFIVFKKYLMQDFNMNKYFKMKTLKMLKVCNKKQ